MNIKKLVLLLLTITLLAAALISCDKETGGTNVQEITIDIGVLAERLASDIKYDDSMSKVEDYVLEMLYDCADESLDSVGYCASGGTSEAVAVFACEDEEKAATVAQKLETFRKSMAEDYVRYTVGEVDKLTNAVVETKGKYTIFCVSPDSDRAKEIINEYVAQLQS